MMDILIFYNTLYRMVHNVDLVTALYLVHQDGYTTKSNLRPFVLNVRAIVPSSP